MRRLWLSGPVAAAVVAGFLVLGAVGVAAQEASPPAGMEFPDPAECTVEPRSADELRVLIQQAATPSAQASPAASPTPAALPPGEPADEQTVAEINATWRGFIACVNANDFPRVFAFVSDDKLRRDFVADLAGGATEEMLVEFFGATPTAHGPAERAPFLPLTDMRILTDGRVAAIGAGETGQGEVLIFVREGERWLIDDQFELQPGGTPAAGTPAA